MYNNIVDPKTRKKINVNSKLGKSIVKNYLGIHGYTLNTYSGGGNININDFRISEENEFINKIEEELPRFDELLNNVKDLVKENWTNNQIDKSLTYRHTNEQSNPDIHNLFTMADLKEKKYKIEITAKPTNPKGKPTLDDQNLLKDVFTNFNVTDMFSNREVRSRVIYTTIKTMEVLLLEVSKIDSSINPDSVGLLFKGGVVVRLIAYDLFRNFVTKIENYLNSITKEDLKISDFDFELITMDKIPSKTLNKLHTIIFIMTGLLKNYMQANYTLFFDLFNYSKDYQIKKIKQLGKNLQDKLKADTYDGYYKNSTIDAIKYKSSSPHDPSDIVYMKQNVNLKKYTIVTDPNDVAIITNMQQFTEKQTHTAKITAENLMRRLGITNNIFNQKFAFNSLVCTHNSSVKLKAENLPEENEFVHFQLNRIKYSYLVYMTLGAGDNKGKKIQVASTGEVVDISSKFKDDRKKKGNPIFLADKFSDAKDLKLYSFIDSDLKFKSYTINGFVHDSNEMLFMDTNFVPWKDKKWGKRLSRLILLVFLLYFRESNINYQVKLDTMFCVWQKFRLLKGNNRCEGYEIPDSECLQDFYNNIQITNNQNYRSNSTELGVFLARLLKVLGMFYTSFKTQAAMTRNQSFPLENFSSMSLVLNNKEVYV